MFRPLRADEVEARVAQCSQKGASLLLYKTSRTDMALLDEAVGPERWQCRYKEVKGVLNCSIGVKFGDEWVWKQAAGTPSNMEAQKGESSDALKRAGFLWGIGRELYTAPFIWVRADRLKRLEKSERTGKWQCFDRFEVAQLEVEGGRIVAFAIVREGTSEAVFTWRGGASAAKAETAPQSVPEAPTEASNGPASAQQLNALMANVERLANLRHVTQERVLKSLVASKACQRAGLGDTFEGITDAQAQVCQMVIAGWIQQAER